MGTQKLTESWSHVWGPVPSAGSCPGSREGGMVNKGAELDGPGLPGE